MFTSPEADGFETSFVWDSPIVLLLAEVTTALPAGQADKEDISHPTPFVLSLVEGVIKGITKEVVVAHKDRLSRFGSDFIIWLFEQYGCKTIVLSDNEQEGELKDELMEIITVFTARYYGKRRYKNVEDKNLSIAGSEGDVSKMFWSE
jgi:hypothetical protein